MARQGSESSDTRVEGVLRIVENGREREHRLSDETSIGRSLDNDIQILDLRSSKLHCRIVRDEAGYTLVDEGSTNGTRLNGEPVTRSLLYPGDIVEIGEVKLHYEGDPPVGPRSSAATALGEPAVRARPAPVVRPGKRQRRATEAVERSPHLVELVELLEQIAKAHGEAGLRAADAVLAAACRHHGVRGVAAEARELVAKLLTILEGNVRLLQERNLRKLLEAILDAAIATSGAERGFIILRDAGGGRTGIVAARNIDRESLKRPAEKFSHYIAERVLATGEGMVSANAAEDERFSESMSVSELSLRSILCVPIVAARAGASSHTAAGVIYVDNRFSESVFGEEDLQLLGALGTQAALALENARLFEAERRISAELAVSQHKLEEANQELAAKLDQQRIELVELRSSLPAPRELKYNYENIIGSSPAMRRVFETLDKVIDSDVPVLIHGESGTGKELVARAIHENGPRKHKPYVSENCAAISETLLESELFGHVRGAFTDAHADKPGLFEIADGGTLFLDEIADMSPGMQSKLLRALQDGEIRRVGGKRAINVDVRVIAASNRMLRNQIKRGEFREDLYYRLNVITIELPPLRERREDVPTLVQHFLDRIAAESGSRHRITREALAILGRYDWPGNVRELENEMRRACALSDEIIDRDVLSPEIVRKVQALAPMAPVVAQEGVSPEDVLPEGVGLKELVKSRTLELERRIIERSLEELGWRKSEVAERLQVSRPTLDAKIELFGLKPPPDPGGGGS
jgi:transcriptional regulator with GAF, ATPase, and Fis domain